MLAYRARLLALAATTAVVVVASFVGAGAASADSKPTDPTNVRTPPTVTADPLPTVQVNGVVWDQAVVGDTVYVVGRFTKARPAGAPPGTSEVTRNNMLAFDIRTGVLKNDFVPDLNAEALSVAPSADGSKVYVAGGFTAANGQTRYRAAAYSTSTGALDPTFRPAFDGQTRAVTATASSVYYGGNFSRVGPTPSLRIASVDPGNGLAKAGFSASADLRVIALTMTPDRTKLVVGGAFEKLNGVTVRGIGAVDAATGASTTWRTNEVVYGYGNAAAILSLNTDGNSVYGTAYSYAGTGNFEGAFRASGTDGSITWIEDCHGDTYSTFATQDVVYTAGHAHHCSNVGGFPEESPRNHYRGLAFTKAVTGTIKTNNQGGYANFAGQPAPTLTTWFPNLAAGTFTGQNQGPWSVDGTGSYIVYAGEFPTVNGVAQQGIVRFANPTAAPNRVGPLTTGFTATATASRLPRRVVVRWNATSDQDNSTLVYRVYRDGALLRTVAADSTFWSKPALSFTDSTVSAGSRTYRVTATDPFGNVASTPNVAVTVR